MKRVEQEKTVTYIIDEENRTVKAVIRNLKWDALNTIFRLFIKEDVKLRFSLDIILNNTYSATAKCSEKDEFDVEVIDGEYIVSGPAVERLMGRVNIQDNESMHYFQRQLNELGIEARLKNMGIKEGDTVKILEWEFEWYN